MWSSFENRLNLANRVSTPCGITSITTEQQLREPGTEFLDNDPVTVFGPRVSDQATDLTGVYIYGRLTNTCCNEDFIDHKSWKDHMKKHDSNITSTYQLTTALNVPEYFLLSLVFQVTSPNVYNQPPAQAEIRSSGAPTVKLPSALREDLVSIDEEDIPLSMKQTKTLRGPKSDGPKKSSCLWLNAKLQSPSTSPTTTSYYIPTSLTAP